MERPSGVPSEAVWSESDHEWMLASTDEAGEKHGEVLYWRPDGSLVNRCFYRHGTVDGPYYRYHESGEVSRQGSFKEGQIHGVDVFTRSASPSSESFPAGLSEQVWRAELDMEHGRAVSGRCFTQAGAQVTEAGEPVPERPAGVSEQAVFSSQSELWLVGGTDEACRKQGQWRFYSMDGALVKSATYEAGEERSVTVYDDPLEGAVDLALEEGREADALEAAKRLSLSEDDRNRCVGVHLTLKVRHEEGVKAALALAKDIPDTSGWWVFTRQDAKALTALAYCLDAVAWAQVEELELEEALETINRAITLHPNPPVSLYVSKARILLANRHEEETYALTKTILTMLPDEASRDQLLELLDVRPQFEAWLEALALETMSEEAAWILLGERGERLLEIAEHVRSHGQFEPVELGYYDSAWPIDEALGEALSPELQLMVQQRKIINDHASRFTCLEPVLDSSVIGGIKVRDGIWVARFQSVFLPISMINCQGETAVFASWAPTEHGTSRVYRTHADERGFALSYSSIAAYLSEQIQREYEGLQLPPALKERWARAVELTDQAQLKPLPPHLDVDHLEPRTLWLITHLLGVNLGDPFNEAPTLETYELERPHLKGNPHLQAYWLMHHLALGNHELLAEVMEHADTRYMPVDELMNGARAALEGEPIPLSFWDEQEVRALRASVMEGGYSALMSAEAQARYAEATAARAALEGKLKEERARLASLGDERVDDLLGDWDRLTMIAGRLEEFNEGVIDQFFEGDEHREMFMRAQVGHMMGPTIYLSAWLKMGVDARFTELFRTAVLRGVGYPEDHEMSTPGALLGLGLALGDFEALTSTLTEAGYDLEELEHHQRAELALAAGHLGGDEALETLRQEAHRYISQFSDWDVDTMYVALLKLLELKDPVGDQLLTALFHQSEFSGANWGTALHLVDLCAANPRPELGEAMWGALTNHLGNSAKGERTRVAVAFARCGDPERLEFLEELSAGLEERGNESEASALIAALVTTDVNKYAPRAKALLTRVLSGEGLDREVFGGATGLLLTLHQLGQLNAFELEARGLLARIGDAGDESLKLQLTEALSGL